MATIEEFNAIDMRIGRIVRAEPFLKARKPAYKLWIDFGELGVLRSSAQITTRYAVEELRGRLVIAVVNFPPRQIADFSSVVLVLGAHDAEGAVVLLEPEREVGVGSRIS